MEGVRPYSTPISYMFVRFDDLSLTRGGTKKFRPLRNYN